MPQSKTQTGKLNKKSKHISTLYPDPSHKEGQQRLKTKGWRETHQSNGEERKTKQTNKKKTTGVVTFVSDNIDYNSDED